MPLVLRSLVGLPGAWGGGGGGLGFGFLGLLRPLGLLSFLRGQRQRLSV